MAPKHLSAVLLAAVCAFILALAAPMVAGDPDMLQDYCVADYKSLRGPLRLNGIPCKRPENVTANDFFSDALATPGNTSSSPVGSAVTAANMENLPGLNTMGVSMSRVDYAPWGVNPPHTHPRATEIIFVLKGSLSVGFVTTSGKVFSRIIRRGELYVFPHGLLHFQRNNRDRLAVAISAFNSQLPGTQTVAVALFGASPPLPTDVLASTLQIDARTVEAMKSKFQLKY